MHPHRKLPQPITRPIASYLQMNTRPPARTLTLLATLICTAALRAQQTPIQIVKAAVDVELRADHDDHSAWIYTDHDVTPEHDTLYFVCETPNGIVKRELQIHGHPLTPAQLAAEDARLQSFAADLAKQQKQKHDEKHDDDQADDMLKLLPRAFLWSIKSQQGDLTTLTFQPDPAFRPNSIAARVLASMAGEIVVNRPQNRIAIIQGALVADVTMGWGMVMRLHKGGSFYVQRKEIAPGHWQITDSRVHIDGHALFFKTIGEQEDETRRDFRPSPAITIPQGVEIVNQARTIK